MSARSALAALLLASWSVLLTLVASACLIEGTEDGAVQRGEGEPSVRYASEVVSFEPGQGAGFGSEKMPDVVLGEPRGGGPHSGSLDVLSLGVSGQIVLGFGPYDLVDGEGADLIVFENAFFVRSTRKVFAEAAEVAVSVDGVNWRVFACDPISQRGCAGLTPTRRFDVERAQGQRPSEEELGGDAFDLKEVGLERARYVRITDRATTAGAAPSAGFDLDAVMLRHAAKRSRAF